MVPVDHIVIPPSLSAFAKHGYRLVRLEVAQRVEYLEAAVWGKVGVWQIISIQDTFRLRINFPFHWFGFSLRTWATTALT